MSGSHDRQLAVYVSLAGTLVLFGCTPGMPSGDAKGKADAKADELAKLEPSDGDTAPTQPEPAATSAATSVEAGENATPGGTPASAFELPKHAPVNGWSCLCFKEKGNEGPELVTACRRSAAACGALQRRVEGGSPTLIRNSTPEGMGCRVIGDAKHPNELIDEGNPDGWLASQKPGAFSYVGECLLDADTSTTGELEYSIGPLSLGMSSAKVTETLGEPDEKGEIWEEAATGEWVQNWTYGEQGLSLMMASGAEKGQQVLGTITAHAPCRLETPRGVAVGDPFDEAKRTYARFAAPKWEHGEDYFVAGSIYGGVIFHVAQSEHGEQVVESIFIGAAAE